MEQMTTTVSITFETLVESIEELSEERIIAWLNSGGVEFTEDDFVPYGINPKFSDVIEYPYATTNEIFNLDPATAGVLITGLGMILAWVSTERRHRESLSNTPPRSGEGDGIDSPDLCKKVENEKVCSLPLCSTMRVNGVGFLILFRACTKKPTPHTTVEYYEL